MRADPPCAGRITGEGFATAHGAWFEVAAAIGANTVERTISAVCAEGTLERADEGPDFICRKIGIAAFAIGAHLEHWRAYFSFFTSADLAALIR